MGWHYKTPQTFPATYLDSLRAATSDPGGRVLLASLRDRRDIEVIAERFRHFRWCVRQIPNAHHEIFLLLETHEIRTMIEEDETIKSFHLWLTAKPTKLSEFVRLNPELAGEVLSNCQ